jgi:predicted transcriptional regulator
MEFVIKQMSLTKTYQSKPHSNFKSNKFNKKLLNFFYFFWYNTYNLKAKKDKYMTDKNTPARRFINAYNQIDHGLRTQYNLKRSMSFSDLIRQSVMVNHIVRKHEDELVDFGRLRNAIIHRSNDDFVIAEPHESVVLQIEKIAKLITTPPRALESITAESVLTVDYDVTIENVISLMAEHSFSNLPVYKNGTLIGIANGQKILERIGKVIRNKKDVSHFLSQTQVWEALDENSPYKQYEVMPASASIEKVLDLFFKNRKLLAVLITKTGTMNEPPLGIITSTNVMELNTILENY